MAGRPLEIIDSDMHVRDLEPLLRKHLSTEFGRRERLFPHDNFDRRMGNTLGKEVVDAATQLKDMDAESIRLAVLYPTNGLSIGEIREERFAVALARAYNEWIADYCHASPERLRAVALLPVYNGQAAAEELDYAVRKLGLVGGMVPSYIRAGVRNVGSRDLDPLYARAQELNVPIAIHASGGLTPVNDRMDSFLAVHVFSHIPEQMAAVTAVVFGGVLERFRTVRIGFMEAGCAWVPFWLHHMDEEFELRHAELPELTAKPSEYLTSGRCYFGVESDDAFLRPTIDAIGYSNLLYASDYPHWDSEWPNSSKTAVNREDLNEEEKRAILGKNCQEFYRFSLAQNVKP